MAKYMEHSHFELVMISCCMSEVHLLFQWRHFSINLSLFFFIFFLSFFLIIMVVVAAAAAATAVVVALFIYFYFLFLLFYLFIYLFIYLLNQNKTNKASQIPWHLICDLKNPE